MLRLILITILSLIICACAPYKPMSHEEYEPWRKRVEEWPKKFEVLLKTPVNALIDAWGKPDGVEADQSGARTYRWTRENVSYSSLSYSSRHPIYDKNGHYVSSYVVLDAPIESTRELECEIRISTDATGLITDARYKDSNDYCPAYFPIPRR